MGTLWIFSTLLSLMVLLVSIINFVMIEKSIFIVRLQKPTFSAIHIMLTLTGQGEWLYWTSSGIGQYWFYKIHLIFCLFYLYNFYNMPVNNNSRNPNFVFVLFLNNPARLDFIFGNICSYSQAKKLYHFTIT